jgi:hypothetical protein
VEVGEYALAKETEALDGRGVPEARPAHPQDEMIGAQLALVAREGLDALFRASDDKAACTQLTYGAIEPFRLREGLVLTPG